MIGWHTAFPGELMCEAAGLRAGQKVFDVATGSGNTALSAARRNCEAVGIDYVPALVERARATCCGRGTAGPIRGRRLRGDSISRTASFDVVFRSTARSSPRNKNSRRGAVASVPSRRKDRNGELDAGGILGTELRIAGALRAAAAGLRPAPEWGTEPRLRELFGEAVTSTQIERKSALFRFRSPQHWIEVFSTYFGPIMRTLEDAGLGSVAAPISPIWMRRCVDSIARETTRWWCPRIISKSS